MRNLLWKLIAAVGLVGCVTTSQQTDEIYVRSVGLEMDSSRPITFRFATPVKGTLIESADGEKIKAACYLEAERRGFNIVSGESECSSCYVVFFKTNVEKKSRIKHVPERYDPGSTTCYNNTLLNGVSCFSSPATVSGGYSYDDVYFSKITHFFIFDPLKSKSEEVRRIGTVFASRMDVITKLTAEYFCRGFFVGFEKDVADTFELPERRFAH